ncbi:SDR family oxidoreductase [Kribbella sp. NPDC026611]|uniref:SDR family oxidoreductase n=1 Tax=Kribbella sp. NPDC026611 TaxID=3154911 RepID=UPI0033D75D78
MEHLTNAFAKEVGARGITANCVAPGPLNTSFYYPVETDESIAGAKARSIGNRLGEIHDARSSANPNRRGSRRRRSG